MTPQTAVPQPPSAGDVLPPPLPVTGSMPTSSGIAWGRAFRMCLIAAVVSLLLTVVLRFPLLVILAIPAGGWLATFLYARGRLGFPMNAGIGARLGAVTGLIGFALNSLIIGASFLFQRSTFLQQMKQAMQEAADRSSDPNAQQVIQKLMSPEGVAIMLTLIIVVMFLFYLVLGAIGGAIGGGLHRHRDTSSSAV